MSPPFDAPVPFVGFDAGDEGPSKRGIGGGGGGGGGPPPRGAEAAF